MTQMDMTSLGAVWFGFLQC